MPAAKPRRRLTGRRKPPTRWGGASWRQHDGGYHCTWYVDGAKKQRRVTTEAEVAEIRASVEGGKPLPAKAAVALPPGPTWSEKRAGTLRRLARTFHANSSKCWHQVLTLEQRMLLEALAERDMQGIMLVGKAIEVTGKGASAAKSFIDLREIEDNLAEQEKWFDDVERAEHEHTASAPAAAAPAEAPKTN